MTDTTDAFVNGKIDFQKLFKNAPPPKEPADKYVITYPYPPFVVMPDGSWYETLDYATLVKLVYSLRDRVNELEKGGKNEGH